MVTSRLGLEPLSEGTVVFAEGEDVAGMGWSSIRW